MMRRISARHGKLRGPARKAVEQADEFLVNTTKRLAEVFASEREKLESAWDKTDNISTEDLRNALRRYRSLFERFISGPAVFFE
jgi:hypothetical protein